MINYTDVLSHLVRRLFLSATSSIVLLGSAMVLMAIGSTGISGCTPDSKLAPVVLQREGTPEVLQ